MRKIILHFFMAIIIISLFTLKLFAGIGVGESPVGTLPVELTSFTAKQSVNGVELRWVTATEVSNYGFEVERAYLSAQNGEPIWEKLGFVIGHGNSNSTKDYSFVDNKPQVKNSKYRLKQIDNNGAFKYSDPIEVGSSWVMKFTLQQNYPNPFNPTTVISYSVSAASNVILKIYDVLGKLITTLVNENQEAGNYKVNFNAGGLSNGIYYYKIQSGNFVAIKKMLLLK
jgi:hypothetical protein